MPFFIKNVLKEEYLHYSKNNKKFDEDNYPYFSPPA
jgi:hypothetical protein